MGRTNGKLVTFLKDALDKDKYINLKYEMPNSDAFYLEFPRFDKKKPEASAMHAEILKDWYICNGKGDKYYSPSNAKSVLKAGMKKSVYLITQPSSKNMLRFRFATKDEIREKKQFLKEKEKNLNNPPLSVSSSSSGYITSEDQDIGTEDQTNDKLKSLCDDLFNSLDVENIQLDPFEEIVPEELNYHKPPDQCLNLLESTVDLNPTVQQNFYWKFLDKQLYGSVSLHIFQQQLIANAEDILEENKNCLTDFCEKMKNEPPSGVFESDGKMFLFYKELELMKN